MSPQSPSVCFLFDNGSLRADSTLSLRGIAKVLALRLGMEVRAVSLLHSSNVPVDELGGEPARLLEPSLLSFFETAPTGRAVLLPLFFGPSAALTDYVPARITAVKQRFPGALIETCPWLVDVHSPDRRIATILADRVRAVLDETEWQMPNLVMVDHGSPQPAVAAVRNHLGGLLAEALRDRVSLFAVSSMERREGDAYAFNDPLLANVLQTPPFDRGNTIIALQFLSPGRHAGPGGDIAMICKAAEAAAHGLRTRMTEPIGGDSRLIDVLVDRYAQAVRS